MTERLNTPPIVQSATETEPAMRPRPSGESADQDVPISAPKGRQHRDNADKNIQLSLRSGIENLDARISHSKIEDIPALVEARGQLVAQNELAFDGSHLRSLQNWSIGAKIIMSIAAIGAGIALVLNQFDIAGFVILGAGLYWLAPDFVRNLIEQIIKKHDNE